MTIFYVALIVIALAVAIYLVRLFMDGRRLLRQRGRGSRPSYGTESQAVP
jgi:hypothetical protein